MLGNTRSRVRAGNDGGGPERAVALKRALRRALAPRKYDFLRSRSMQDVERLTVALCHRHWNERAPRQDVIGQERILAFRSRPTPARDTEESRPAPRRADQVGSGTPDDAVGRIEGVPDP